MHIAVTIALFILGIALIVKGGDLFVYAAGWIAEVSGIPKFIIGATIVSFATTLPELIVSLIAAMDGKVDMSVGNAVGSVTANLGLIMGISIACMPAVISRKQLAPKSIIMAVACGLLFAFSYNGELALFPSILLLCVFLVFVYENIHEVRRINAAAADDKPREKPQRKTVVVNIIKFILGAAGIVVGAQLLVDYGSEIARLLGVPEAIIGVTMVAIGTSLPELVTTITAIAKKQSSLSIGNIIGANIIDLTVILPICSIVSGGSLPIARQSAVLDMPVCLGVVLLAIAPPLIAGRFRRAQGIIMMAAYVAYVAVLCIFFI